MNELMKISSIYFIPLPFLASLLYLWIGMTLVAADLWQRHAIDASSQGADGVRLMDVNGDGRQDIATAWEEGGIVRAYLQPDKAKRMEPWPAVTVGQVKSGEDAVFVDLDDDGAVDVVSACEGKTQALYVHWAPKEPDQYLNPNAWTTAIIPSSRNRMQWMYSQPMNVDGRHGIDLVVAGKGKGGEIGWYAAPSNPRDLAAWRYESIYPVGWIMSIQLEDMDGDGDDDVLYSDRKGSSRGIYWLERVGDLWQRHDINVFDREFMFLATGDLDSDGRKDVICAVRDQPILWCRNTEEGWSLHEIALPEGVGSAKSVAIADMDGDDRCDVIFSCERATGALSGLRWISWEENPMVGPWQSHEIGGPQGVKFDRIVLRDIDEDGDLDVLTCEERDQLGVVWYENP